MAVLMLTLKAEQAAVQTISPPEWRWSDCLLLFQIPPGACSHFLCFYISLIFPGLFLSLCRLSRSSALGRSVLVDIHGVWGYIP